MAKQKISQLMNELHSHFGDNEPSDQQRVLLEQVEASIHGINESEPVSASPLQALELLRETLEDEHPQVSAVLTELAVLTKKLGL